LQAGEDGPCTWKWHNLGLHRWSSTRKKCTDADRENHQEQSTEQVGTVHAETSIRTQPEIARFFACGRKLKEEEGAACVRT
jgi:hypothetical protein